MTEETISVASGRLKWAHDGEDLVAGRYRIRQIGPGRWETIYRGRPLELQSRRSFALARAEHHHREIERKLQILRWALLAGISFMTAVLLANWIHTPLGFLLFAVAAGFFLGSVARWHGAASRNLLDPYRPRESWESPDWWNH